MAKNIVICSDGTGNTAMKGRGTNVFKLFEAVNLHDKNIKQVAIYDDGVGTQSFSPWKLLCGAFGIGLKSNVVQLYVELAHIYNPGDRLYLYGFSRGAFTVRTLAGLIYHCGILDHACNGESELQSHAKEAYRAYRCSYKALLEKLFCSIINLTPWSTKCCNHEHTKKITDEYALEHPSFKSHDFTDKKTIPEIEVIGVWDTVSAMGFPILWMSELINTIFYRFHFPTTHLNNNVNHAYHALSIDENRQTFHPLMWTETEDERPHIEQVWFSGVHSNVGGGYPRHGMSLVSLEWMMRKSEKVGLQLNKESLNFIEHDKAVYSSHRNIADKLYDSRSGIKEIYRYKPRDIRKLCVKPKIHVSTFYRIAQHTEGYAPGNIPSNLEIIYNEGQTPKGDAIRDIVKEAMCETDTLLTKVDRFIFLRRFSHFVLFAILFGVLALWLWVAYSQGVFWNNILSLFSINGLLSFLIYTVTDYWWLLVIAAVFYWLERWSRSKMENYYSNFWHKILKKLRGQFKITNEKIT